MYQKCHRDHNRRLGRVNEYVIDLGLAFELVKLLHILGYHRGHNCRAKVEGRVTSALPWALRWEHEVLDHAHLHKHSGGSAKCSTMGTYIGATIGVDGASH